MKIQRKDKYIIHAISLACFRLLQVIITGQEQKQVPLRKVIEGTFSLEMAHKRLKAKILTNCRWFFYQQPQIV